jgi:hypothetical protein
MFDFVVSRLDDTQESSQGVQASPPVRINIERMQAALASESITIPRGLTLEQMDRFILSHAG